MPDAAHPSRVLVVDDEEAIRVALQAVFEDEGYDVRGAADGQRALDVLAAWRPDVILLDLMMPVMSGWTFRERQLALPGGLDQIPVVVLSGVRDVHGSVAQLGVAAALPKPFDLDDVLHIVARLLEEDTPATSG